MANNPFIPIIKPYFDFLSGWFDNLANESLKHNVQPDDIARDFLGDKKLSEGFNKYILPEISGRSILFWQQSLPNVLHEINKLPGLKARFGGDIGPQSREKLYQRLGIYFNSIIVPDPILRSVTIPGPNKHRDYYILKFAINLILNRDIYLADIYPPIAVLVGEDQLLGDPRPHYGALSRDSCFDAILIANKMFGKDFQTEYEVSQFFLNFSGDKELTGEIADPSVFRMFDEVGDDFLEQLAEMDKETRLHYNEDDQIDQMKGPKRVWHMIHNRMMQINETLHQSTEMDAHPVIQAPVSFHWLKNKVNVNAEIMSAAMEEDLQKQLPLTNAILSKNLEWLSNIPSEALIRVRKNGYLDELRSTIEGNLSNLSIVNLDELNRVTNEVDYNLNSALNRHQEELETLHNKTLDDLLGAVPPLFIAIGGSLQPLLGIIPWWLSTPAGVLGAIVGGMSLKDIVPKIRGLFRDRESMGKTPIGILWHAKQDSELKSDS